MVIIYTSPGCPGCRKAKKWMKENHISFAEKNIFSNILKEAEIKYLLSRCENGTEDIISTRSKAFQNLNRDINDLSVRELVKFIRDNPSVLKRPIMLTEKAMVIGYDKDEITAVVPETMRAGSFRTVWFGQPGTMYLRTC
ncbi:MAG: transcriptional regulator Spx [Erysipelotrichaceae bacterium]|nr:transcriptional regulator Spx [Erysipelotrichaceae bacterium]